MAGDREILNGDAAAIGKRHLSSPLRLLERLPPGFYIAQADPETSELMTAITDMAADDGLDSTESVRVACVIGRAPIHRRGTDQR